MRGKLVTDIVDLCFFGPFFFFFMNLLLFMDCFLLRDQRLRNPGFFMLFLCLFVGFFVYGTILD